MKPILQCCLFAVLAALPPTAFPEERNAGKDTEAGRSFDGYFSARHYDFEYVDEFFQKKIKAAEPLDFKLLFDWQVSRMQFAKFQLHSLVCEPNGVSSDAERLRLFQEFFVWRKYVENERPAHTHYITQSHFMRGMEIDTQRLCTRQEALCLLLKLPEKYKIYARLAGKGKVRLAGAPSHPLRMRYGEITTEEKTVSDEINYDFHAELMPTTCLKIRNGYAGCLRTFESPLFCTPAEYYLGVWDDAGNILALHPLAIPAEKRNKLALETNEHMHLIAVHASDGVYGEQLQLTVSGKYAKVSLFVKGSEKPVWSGQYPLDSRNQNTITGK